MICKNVVVGRATGDSEASTELSPATGTFHHFQPCSLSDIRSAIMGWPSKPYMFDPLLNDMLKKFLLELLPFISDQYVMRHYLSFSQRYATIRLRSNLQTSFQISHSCPLKRQVCHKNVQVPIYPDPPDPTRRPQTQY